MYEEIKNHKSRDRACVLRARLAAGRKNGRPNAASGKRGKQKNKITLETLRAIHAVLTPEEKGKSDGFRKDNPLHRLYFHEISAPDKIQARLKKLIEWLDEEETALLHPVDRAARAHWKLMSIYPFSKNSGKVARLLQNLMLLAPMGSRPW